MEATPPPRKRLSLSLAAARTARRESPLPPHATASPVAAAEEHNTSPRQRPQTAPPDARRQASNSSPKPALRRTASVLDMLQRARAAAAPPPAPEELVPCPCCCRTMPPSAVDAHLDRDCPGLVVDPPAAVAEAPLADEGPRASYLPIPWPLQPPVDTVDEAPAPEPPLPLAPRVAAPEPAPATDSAPPQLTQHAPEENTKADTDLALAAARYYERSLLEMVASVRARYTDLLLPAELHALRLLETMHGARPATPRFRGLVAVRLTYGGGGP